MTYNKEWLNHIFARTTGYCHICRKKLSRNNYGKIGHRGAWEVEHSVPRSKGGTEHSNNLFAACCGCNRAKSNLTTRTARRWNGHTRAPMSSKQRTNARVVNTVLGMVGGAAAGFALGGPVGTMIGLMTGAKIGHSLNPDETG